MSYLLEKSNQSIVSRILEINHVSMSDLNVDNFVVDYDMEILKQFKEKLLSYKDKRFFIVGDYDCDGICATAIMKKLFDDLNIRSNYYIPSRLKEGYGINNHMIDVAKENGFDVILTVDNGIVAYDQIKYANQLGLKVFVIDHHEYEEEPDCDFLHPNQFIEKYSDMCAAGLSCLLSNSIRYDILTTVLGGLATLADMVPVFHYNRYLLKELVKLLKENEILPIKMLLGKNEVSYQSIQFDVIPKINAVSRLDELMNVNLVVRYLLSDKEGVNDYYSKIELINKKRKELTKIETELALQHVGNEDFLLISSREFKEGLCGLIANKLMNEFHKPSLVLSETEGILKGSGRGPNEFNLFEYLNKTKDLFLTFGGHNQAVGLSMQKDNLIKLKEYIEKNPFEIADTDKVVLCLNENEINFDTLASIESLAPYGTGFVKPLIALEDVKIQKRVLVAYRYPKFILNSNLEAISFNTRHQNALFTTIIGRLSKDSYHQNNLSITIEDLI